MPFPAPDLPVSPPSAARQPALFHVGCHVVEPESRPLTMIDRSSKMASFSARYGCIPGKRPQNERGCQLAHGSVVCAPVGATFGSVAKPWGHSGDRHIALFLESGQFLGLGWIQSRQTASKRARLPNRPWIGSQRAGRRYVWSGGQSMDHGVDHVAFAVSFPACV